MLTDFLSEFVERDEKVFFDKSQFNDHCLLAYQAKKSCFKICLLCISKWNPVEHCMVYTACDENDYLNDIVESKAKRLFPLFGWGFTIES
jgi:hypothetical protein